MKQKAMLRAPGEYRAFLAAQACRKVIRALIDARGNYRQAAKALGVARPFLYQVLKGKTRP